MKATPRGRTSLEGVGCGSYTLASEASAIGGPCQQGLWALHLVPEIPALPDLVAVHDVLGDEDLVDLVRAVGES